MVWVVRVVGVIRMVGVVLWLGWMGWLGVVGIVEGGAGCFKHFFYLVVFRGSNFRTKACFMPENKSHM